MKKRIFLTTSLISVLAVVLFFVSTIGITVSQNREMAKNSVIAYTDIFAEHYKSGEDLKEFVKNNQDELRVTVIDFSGKVLADSDEDASKMENHKEREEFKSALNDEEKVYVRKSNTQNISRMYYAKKVTSENGGIVVRCSINIASINSYVLKTLPAFFLILIVVVIIAVILSKYLTKNMTKPLIEVKEKLEGISNGSFAKKEYSHSYEEVNGIMKEIDEVGGVVEENLASLTEEKNKTAYILNSIGEGLFAINSDRNIVLINKTALDIFEDSESVLGNKLNYLTADEGILASIDECLCNQKDVFAEFDKDGYCYALTIKSVASDWTKEGQNMAVVVMKDVTASKNAQKLKEEFFENASHELKTPLTTVKGFVELLKQENKDEKLMPFIVQIESETDRMVGLVLDMLKLSELENRKQATMQNVDIKKVAMEIIEELTPLAQNKNVNITCDGEGEICACEKDIYTLIKNLVENAIKYNKQDGSVKIKVNKKARVTELIVEDNGIGIDREHQARIFERFYRVNESRSRITGGTGLGLSIVKHICIMYNAQISLKSQPDIGTKITISFEN